MEIFKTFGIDPIIIAAQIVNFLVILYILKRFLYKPLFAIFKKREELIKESIEKAGESTKALEKAHLEEKEMLKKAQTTATQIISDAREQSLSLIKHAEESTKKQTDRMLIDAKNQIAQETKAAEIQLSKHVGKLSLEILKKSLKSVFTEKDQTEIVKKATKELEKNKTNE